MGVLHFSVLPGVWSFWFDLKILVLTFFKVTRAEGVSH